MNKKRSIWEATANWTEEERNASRPIFKGQEGLVSEHHRIDHQLDSGDREHFPRQEGDDMLWPKSHLTDYKVNAQEREEYIFDDCISQCRELNDRAFIC